jgi:murein DD-endopeptidase MepM/ murein hydrolase activator NlpD
MITPVKGRVSSKFGNRIHPVTKQHKFHNGVDIAVAVGTQVHAPVMGKIIDVSDNLTAGKTVVMMGADGRRYGFAHLSKQLVKINDFVEEGHVIAETGNTGASTGPHLHFTVKSGADWIDPQTLFSF